MLKQCKKVQYLVVGGGYAGINALAALKRLENVNSALCVDINEKPGGSWHRFYDHARLHTDHRVFGVNMHPWQREDTTLRASQPEVIEHFCSYVKNELPQGFYFQGNTEFQSAEKKESTFKVKLKTSEGDETVEADHVIDARGFNYRAHMTKDQDPLTDSNSQDEVRIQDLGIVLSQAAPPEGRLIVIVGGGLTGIDAVKYSAEHKNANDEILLITGSSKYFFRRDYSTPPIPLSRKTTGEHFGEICLSFNGTNGMELLQKKQQQGLLHHIGDDPARGFVFGVISDEQRRFTNDNCKIITNDHFVRCDGSVVQLKSGKLIQTQKQIIIVNCRSSIQMRDSPYTVDVHPLTSDGILRIGSQLGFTGPTAYLYTLLYGLGKLENMPVWGFDLTRKKITADDTCKFILKVSSNMIVTMNNLPMKFASTFKLHGDLLFPRPRRIFGLLKMTRNKRKILEAADKFLVPL